MGFPNLKVDLDPRPDKYGNTYYIGRIQAPCPIRFKRGITFFVFVSEEGCEELHIGCAKPGSPLSPVKRTLAADNTIDRVIIDLQKKSDADGRPYYLAVVQDDTLEIDLEDKGSIFMVFTSSPGKEQIQVVKNQQQQFDRAVPEILQRGGPRYERKDSSTEFRIPTIRRAGNDFSS